MIIRANGMLIRVNGKLVCENGMLVRAGPEHSKGP